mgnify:CR=1 FL=1
MGACDAEFADWIISLVDVKASLEAVKAKIAAIMESLGVKAT